MHAGSPPDLSLSRIPHRIESCEAQAYHLSASIQPHGVFLGLDRDDFRIHRFSANVPAVLGQTTSKLLSRNFLDLLVPTSIQAFSHAVDRCGTTRASVSLRFRHPTDLAVTAVVWLAGPLTCVEFEAPRPQPAEAEITSPRFFELVDRITQADGPSRDLPSLVCDAIREVSGFDRVYYCVFDEAGHGRVFGESRNDRLPDLMDHRFPATDIPEAARRMFVINPFRLIPDVAAQAIPILGGDGGPLDLSMSTCRAVAPSHLRYVQNMGVRASMSFPVTREGRLDALFGGHHATPRPISFRQMTVCRHFVTLFQNRSDSLRIREERGSLATRIETLLALAAGFRSADRDLTAFVAANHDAFRTIMDADDMLCRFERQSYTGRHIGHDAAQHLLAFLEARLAGGVEIYQTDRLGQDNLRLGALCPGVAGVFAVSLDLSGGNIIAWLRREVIVVEKWSGDPHQPITPDGHGGIGPRTSFQAWRREVKGTSVAWPSVAHEVARQTRHDFALVLASHYESAMRRSAEQANTLKSAFVANISHELRSPMHAILGFADVLATADDSMPLQKRQRYAGAIQDSGSRLLNLINDLLDLSALEAGKMAFTFAEADIRPSINSAIAEISDLARTKAVVVEVQDRAEDTCAILDAARMGQVMTNLLTNALKFSPPGGRINISLDTTGNGPGGRRLVIETADQGVGIPPDELETVFDKFVQSSRTRHGGGGTGLGLSICREIIEAHRGRIRALNSPSGGACFIIDLPIGLSADSISASEVTK